MYPPLGEAPKEEKKTAFSAVASMTSGVYSTIVDGVQKTASMAGFGKKKEAEEDKVDEGVTAGSYKSKLILGITILGSLCAEESVHVKVNLI